jgi:hypothetical protein
MKMSPVKLEFLSYNTKAIEFSPQTNTLRLEDLEVVLKHSPGVL